MNFTFLHKSSRTLGRVSTNDNDSTIAFQIKKKVALCVEGFDLIIFVGQLSRVLPYLAFCPLDPTTTGCFLMKDQDVEGRQLTEKKTSTVAKQDRKGWTTQRTLGRERLLRRSGIPPVTRRPPRPRRRLNLNKHTLQPEPPSDVSKPPRPTPLSSPDLKRKLEEFDTKPRVGQVKCEAVETEEPALSKKSKQSPVNFKGKGHGEETHEGHVPAPGIKSKNKKQRQREKEKRQKLEKQARNEEHRRLLEERAEAESSEPRRFFVGIPLDSVSSLSGKSVCRHFRKRDLVLNDILPVPLETLLASRPARSLYESLSGPIYFPASCRKSLKRLRKRLKYAAVCSKLLVVTEERFKEVLRSVPTGDRPPRLLSEQTLAAIEQVLEDAQPPHDLESSQNAEDKIKCLFKPILRSLGLHDHIITTGFSWKEKIGLRSTVDLGTHGYAPKSDAAIIKLLDNNEAKILVLFEAYSKIGQSLNTPDDNRADRVRLLIQGSYVSVREGKPSVVFYLTRDKCMETIFIFSEDEEQGKFGYHAEKRPFYDEVAWVDLVCQIINLVFW